MPKKPIIPTVLDGKSPWPIFGLGVFTLAVALLCLLTNARSQNSVGGFPMWLIGILLILFTGYLWAIVFKTLSRRKK
jgi:hypothetical protein